MASLSSSLTEFLPVLQSWCMAQPEKANEELGDVQLWITFTFSWFIMGLQVRSVCLVPVSFATLHSFAESNALLFQAGTGL